MKKEKKEKKGGLLKEFKAFVMRGNVLDMAVGMVIGSAFTAIVTSIVQDIINPIVGLLIGKIDFKDLRLVIIKATETTSEVSIRYGSLIQTIIQFLITALVLFFVIKGVNKLHDLGVNAKNKAKTEEEPEAEEVKEEAPVPPVVNSTNETISENTELLKEIRDLLKERKEMEKTTE